VPECSQREETLRAVELCIPRLRRFARGLVRDDQTADDLVQDALERAVSRLHQFQPGTNMGAWLFTIARNVRINDLRKDRMVATDPTSFELVIAAPPAQEDVLVMADLRAAIARMPRQMREVMLLVGVEGLDYGEAGLVLGVNVGTVKSRLSRGRDWLAHALDPEGATRPGAARLRLSAMARAI